ncbi:hypothetical protein [Halorubrum vacuolatum]|uniref:Methyltransferase n=1 Tax=Halorubrum vacuolatum TaxID=63740 RepID=A0A238WYE7_HALVU|nr:hypothetical protein [Halorubrum vacuolatum]SNR51448.1 hypothetical protein SAMN06264855_11145 [Halorubrum vacuolatum]
MTTGDGFERHTVGPGGEYIVGDALAALADDDDEAAAIFLDDAWARPGRREQTSVSYQLHPFDDDQPADGPQVTDALTTTQIIDACYGALMPGGWLIADVDDWLLPRFVSYLRETWGDATEQHEGGGFRRIGGVTYLTADGQPDRDTHGPFLSTGGYSVVFAHKGPTERRTAVSARQVARWPTETYGRGGRAKPVEPYAAWLSGLVEPGELVIIPCAGTAPAAIAARQTFGDDARFRCIDIEPAAYEGFKRRYAAHIDR